MSVCGSWRLEKWAMQLFDTFETGALGCATTRRRHWSPCIIRLVAMFIVTSSAVAEQTTKDSSEASLEELTTSRFTARRSTCRAHDAPASLDALLFRKST